MNDKLNRIMYLLAFADDWVIDRTEKVVIELIRYRNGKKGKRVLTNRRSCGIMKTRTEKKEGK